ncbi:unnamed protein product [Mytilus coruscus]|uniref:DNA helicase n=1 Tax=Mytilus coruscus TaxID=42192 RepID=A0A6J8ECV8_MYTCO|nr:unnamed protein product [Mytilus coruscus]
MDSYIFQPPKSGYMPLAVNLWADHFCMTELNIIMRQRENKEFAELLNRLREGNHTSDDIELLKTQCIEESSKNYPHDTPHVFFSNKKVNEYNATIFQKIKSVKTTAKAKSKDVSQLSTILEIAEGLTYEITLNLDCEDGLINGAACIVQKIKLTEIQYASGIIWVKFPSETTGNFLRQNKKHLYSEEIHSSWTPIEPATRQFAAGYKGESQIQRMQFPLRPAAAKTIHRPQGDTLNKLVVDLASHCKIDHIHYVALSRVTTIQGLKILHLQKNKISINSAVKKEMECLRKIPPATSLTF